MNAHDFLNLLPAIRKAAKNLGYAVGLHGSLSRDFDLVAVAWADGAADPDELALAIRTVAGGLNRWRVWREHGHQKPFGRVCYCFDWEKGNYDNSGYCDLSVIPPLGWILKNQ